jgi:hypothetical protein
MLAPEKSDLSPRFEREILFGQTVQPPRGHRPLSDADNEDSFQSMREECMRTLALMRSLRLSHFYRFASAQFDDVPEWPSWPA